MSDMTGLSWLHAEIQKAILQTGAGGQSSPIFTVRSNDAIAEVKKLSLAADGAVFDLVDDGASVLRFKFSRVFVESCFSGGLISGASVGLNFSPSKYWGKLHKAAKMELLQAVVIRGTNCLPDVSGLQRIVGSEDSIAEMFSKGVLLPSTNAPQGCEISGILVGYVLSKCGLQQEDFVHVTPVDKPSNSDVSREMILRDCEYLAGTFRSFKENEFGANRSENLLNHLVFWTSVWVVESSAKKFSSIVPQGELSEWGANRELIASRHAVKFLADKKPVLNEISSIIRAWCEINSHLAVPTLSIVFFNGKLLTTTHTEDFLMGMRYEDGDDPKKVPEYPFRKVTEHVIQVLNRYNRGLPPLDSEESFIRSTSWDGLSHYTMTSIYLSHAMAFRGVQDIFATSLLLSCQAIITVVADVIPADRRQVSSWVTFRKQYLVIHSIRTTLETLAVEPYVTKAAKKRIDKILETSFITKFKMRNELMHYDISEWEPDPTQEDFGLSRKHHEMNYKELRLIVQNEATRLSNEMNRWGLREHHSGMPFISSWFKKTKPNLLERVLRKVARDPIDKFSIGRL